MTAQPNHYKRIIGPWTMLFASVSAIIGSGWLFSGYYSSKLAGPAAIVAWCLAAVLILIVAFTFAEISSLIPIPGGSSHLPNITHGILVSVVFSWISWLTLAVIPAIEVQAVLQYAAYFFPWLTSDPNSIDTTLSPEGYMVAGLLLILFSVTNIYSLRFVMRFNSAIAIWKIIIPILAALTLLVLSFHADNFSQTGGFMPYGWHGVFTAMATGGIIFAFNGFKNVVELAGEAKNPKRTIPFALIGSIVVCLVVYILLQLGFIGAVPATSLTHGWSGLSFPKSSSPLVTLLAMGGSVFILGVLYIDTLIAPFGAGFIYVTAGSRTLQAMSKNHQMPHPLQWVNEKGIPITAILVNLVLNFVFFFPFPGWKLMVDFMTSLMAFSYVLGPVCLLALRYQLPNRERVIKLPFGTLWSFLALYICSLMGYWTGWGVIFKLGIFIVFAVGFYLVYRSFSKSAREVPLDFKASIWVFVYFSGLILISYLGNFGGGKGYLSFGSDFMVIALLTAFSLFLAVKFKVADRLVAERVQLLEENRLVHKTIVSEPVSGLLKKEEVI
ncbi:MAG: APC family permease [Legionellales bacterium]|nr:APC family permease [Legionellales bacterium]